jgi:hypothetical protein
MGHKANATAWKVRGLNPGGGEIFRTCPDRPWVHTASCTIGIVSFLGVKSGRGVTLTTHLLLVSLVMKEWSYTSTPLMGRTACTERQCLYKGDLYLYLTVELYLYSPYGLYGLYRASVPVQGCTLHLPYSRTIPLLPLWAVRPVQSLSACTRVHFTFALE